jgi:electron transport complex protein RnfG
MKKDILYYVKIGASLLLICAFMAGLVSGVHSLTKETIDNYNEEKRAVAFREFFPDTVSSALSDKTSEEVNAVYELYNAENELIGYSVDASASGYAGLVNIMVGITVDGEIKGIKVISHTETKGLTSEETASAFFLQFSGKKGSVALGSDGVEAMSGATISSKAVTKAVQKALALNIGEGE